MIRTTLFVAALMSCAGAFGQAYPTKPLRMIVPYAPAARDVPTVAEAGIPGFDVPTWFGVLVPAATPKDLITKLNGGVVQALNAPDVREQLAREGAETMPMSSEEFGSFIRAETAKFAKIIKDSGATTN